MNSNNRIAATLYSCNIVCLRNTSINIRKEGDDDDNDDGDEDDDNTLTAIFRTEISSLANYMNEIPKKLENII